MYEIRCPSCRLRLWLHQGMRRDVPPPEECPGCHVSRPIDRSDAAAARLAARIADDHHAERARNATAGRDRDAVRQPPAGSSART